MSPPLLRKPSRQAIYTVPAIVAVVSGVGLVFALLGDGIWDAASCAAVGLPVAIAGWVWWRTASQRRQQAR